MTLKEVVNKIPVRVLRGIVLISLSLCAAAGTVAWDSAKTWKAKVDAALKDVPTAAIANAANAAAIQELRTDIRSLYRDQLSFQRDIYIWNGEMQKAKAAEDKMKENK